MEEGVFSLHALCVGKEAVKSLPTSSTVREKKEKKDKTRERRDAGRDILFADGFRKRKKPSLHIFHHHRGGGGEEKEEGGTATRETSVF